MATRGRPRKVVEVVEQVTEQAEEAIVERPTTVKSRAKREKRIPINGYRDVLKVEGQDPEFHYCWVNDDNVPRFERADYEFVTHDVIVGDRKINAASQIGGKVSIPVGNGMVAYLMRIPNEYYNEDMEAYYSEIDEKEAAMKKALNSKEDGRYGGVKLEVNNRLK